MAAVTLEPLPPVEAVQFFRAKGYRLGFDWRDTWQEEHSRAFTVAKAMRLDILQDIRGALDEAIAGGETFESFRKKLEPTLAAKGWWGRSRMTDPQTGEERVVQLGSPRRLRVIYDTNIRMAAAAGRWERIERVKERRPWLRYVAVLDERTRPEHRAWHGTVLPADDAWWRTHYPPNGWNCRCIVQQLSDRDLERFGYAPSAAAPPGGSRSWTNKRTGERMRVPAGIDPGFGYNVGRSHTAGLVPPPRSGPLPAPVPMPPVARPPLPAPRPAPASRLLPDGLAPEDYARRFLGEFGGAIGRPVTFTDAIGEDIIISERMFQTGAGHWKSMKQARHRSLLLLADTLKSPDEIWWQWTEHPPGRFTLVRRYMARWTVEGREVPALVLFDVSADGWFGITAYDPSSQTYLDRRQRLGTLAWRRPTD
ncbi:MAG: PBECR2 nuclease fold domain-containing protein [Alphaproteobacteria bacterium]